MACCIAPANSLRIMFDDYKGGLIAPWEKKSFKVSDSYGIAKGRKIHCIETHRLAAMPVPYYEINHDAEQYPILSWWRKVDMSPKKRRPSRGRGSLRGPSLCWFFPHTTLEYHGHQLYVVQQTSPRDWVTQTITKNSIMILVQRGPNRTGNWLEAKGNVFDDYRRRFGHYPPRPEHWLF